MWFRFLSVWFLTNCVGLITLQEEGTQPKQEEDWLAVSEQCEATQRGRGRNH